MNKKLFTQLSAFAQITVALALIVGVFRVAAGTLGAAPAVPAVGELASGAFDGKALLKVTVGGVYSDTLVMPAPPPAGQQRRADVGAIDLGLFLNVNGGAVTGYVDLTRSMVFSVEHTIQATPVAATPAPGQATPAPAALKIGPQILGTYDGTTLNVQSEQLALVVSGRPVRRQFRLIGTRRDTAGNTIAGEYRETLWGYSSVPLTVVGEFTLSRVGVPLPTSVVGGGGGGGGGGSGTKVHLPIVFR